MMVIMRFRVAQADAVSFLADARAAFAVLSRRPGWRTGQIGKSIDDPTLWAMTIGWENVGAYRRALSSYEVKAGAVALMSRAIDEPSTFEIVTDDDRSARAADAGSVGLGEAAAPVVRTDLD